MEYLKPVDGCLEQNRYSSLKECAVVHPIRRDRLMGMKYTQIAKKYRIDPRTAKRYAEKNLPIDCLEHRPFPSVLDPYKGMINAWLHSGPVKTTTVLAYLRKMGCRCGYTIVNDYIKKERGSYPAGRNL